MCVLSVTGGGVSWTPVAIAAARLNLPVTAIAAQGGAEISPKIVMCNISSGRFG